MNAPFPPVAQERPSRPVPARCLVPSPLNYKTLSLYVPVRMSDSSVYALICYRPNIPGMSKVLLLSGLWLSGTQAAGEFVLNHREFSRFLA
jgi:hypothetical protein